MKKYVSFILDETYSMGIIAKETVSGYNEYLSTLYNTKGEKKIRMTLTKFNSEMTTVVFVNKKLKDIPAMSTRSYHPRGTTPLYDAIGITINKLVDDGVKNPLVIIQTDGMENSSQEFNQEGIARIISEKKEEGWTFVFIGADLDAEKAGKRINIPRGNTLSYAGMQSVGAFSTVATSSVRSMEDDSGVTQDSFFEE